MADAIYGILNYPDLARMIIKNAKEEVILLKWDNSAKHVKDIYHRVIANK
jgi:glycosyltransferase involved in cell wall biosynthesis